MSENQPQVSIVLPTYNGAKYIRQSIDSCLSQAYSNWELIVVDDGSKDETAAIVKSVADTRVRLIALGVNQGHIAALNHGFAQSRGAMLTWTSDDNYYHPRALEVMVRTLQDDAVVDFVYAKYSLVNDSGQRIRSGRILPPEELDEDNCVGGCFLYRRKVYESVGNFNPDAFLAEDYEYWLRVRVKFRMKMIDEDLYFYRAHAESLTGVHKEEKVMRQVEKVRSRFIAPWKNYFYLAKAQYGSGNVEMAKSLINKSVWGNPLNPTAWRLWLKAHMDRASVERVQALKQKVQK